MAVATKATTSKVRSTATASTTRLMGPVSSETGKTIKLMGEGATSGSTEGHSKAPG